MGLEVNTDVLVKASNKRTEMVVRSHNHCRGGKEIIIINCVCVCRIIYPARKAHALFYIGICGLFGSTVFFNIISKVLRFSGRGGGAGNY